MNDFSESSLLPWIVAVTGASGTVYARRLIEAFVTHRPNTDLHVIFSEAAIRVLREEEGVSTSFNKLPLQNLVNVPVERIQLHNNRDIGASIASGSLPIAGMVVVPCSMSTLAAIAHGYSHNLIHRAADVTLKESRRLILVPRETPLSAIHLENMLALAKLGVRVVPAMPGFYHQPQTINDLVDMMVMRIMDQMGISSKLSPRWKSGPDGEQQWPLREVK